MVPVTEGHEVSRRHGAAVHDDYTHGILSEIEAGRPVSQRSLASRLGIALGLTNLLLRRLVRKGLVRVSRIQPNRVGYFLTPTGIAEKARMSRVYFQDSVEFYRSARERLRTSLLDLSRHWPEAPTGVPPTRSVVFLGTGEVAEIAYVCLQETDLQLVGVVDFQGRERFFGVPVYPAVTFTAEMISQGATGVVAIALNDSEQVHQFLAQAGFSAGQVYWI